MTTELTAIRKKLEKKLKEERYIHTLGVMYTAASMAMRHGADVQKAMTAGLLHDCGKYHASLYRRMKKVLIGEKTLDRHNEDSYKKLENINLELAELARDHHYYSDDIYMQRFQELDDK